jgi:multisubunit Na+/H+ antiporter MnhE subunit
VTRRLATVQAARLAIWWVLLFAGWSGLVGEWSPSDLVWGAVAASVAALAGVLVTSSGMVRGTSVGAALKVAPAVVVAVIVDFGIVVGVLAGSVVAGRRDATGAFQRRRVRRRDARSPARRTWLTLASTYSPNAYVIDFDKDSGDVLLHELRPHRISERPV